MRLTDRDIGICAIRILGEDEKEYEKRSLECEQYMKLRELENIEDKLGIDLVILFKALSDGIYIKFDNGDIEHIQGGRIGIFKYYGRYYFTINDLLFRTKLLIKSKKKDWALTAEELQ